MCCATLCMFTFGRPESQPVGSRRYRSGFVSRGLIVLICPSRFLLASSLSPHGISPDGIQYPLPPCLHTASLLMEFSILWASSHLLQVQGLGWAERTELIVTLTLFLDHKVRPPKTERQTRKDNRVQTLESAAGRTERFRHTPRAGDSERKGDRAGAEHLPRSSIQAISQTRGVLKERIL